MNRRLSRVILIALVTLLPLSAAMGQEGLIETKWTVDEKGNLLVHPHHLNTPEENEQGVGRPLFDLAGKGVSLSKLMARGGLLGFVRIALSGPAR